MRLSELSRVTGVAPSTVKWYLRVGLLPRGTATAPNQAQYDQRHVRRLLLVRTLLEVGGLSVAGARQVVDAIDQPGLTAHQTLAIAQQAAAGEGTGSVAPEAEHVVDEYLVHRGWRVSPDSPARHALAGVLYALQRLGTTPAGTTTARAPATDRPEAVHRLLDPYADAVEPLAANEVAGAPDEMPQDELVERVVAGTVLMERALTALRRLAQEHYSRQRYREMG